MHDDDRLIKVEVEPYTDEKFITEELITQLENVRCYGFVCENGRGELELAFGPNLQTGNLKPLIAATNIQFNDSMMQSAAAASAAKGGSPIYLVTFHIRKIHIQVTGEFNKLDERE